MSDPLGDWLVVAQLNECSQMIFGWPNECPLGMVKAGARLNECTWDSTGGQLSDPADKVCIHL